MSSWIQISKEEYNKDIHVISASAEDNFEIKYYKEVIE